MRTFCVGVSSRSQIKDGVAYFLQLARAFYYVDHCDGGWVECWLEVTCCMSKSRVAGQGRRSPEVWPRGGASGLCLTLLQPNSHQTRP
jgi:hypothetical protein